MAPQTLRVLVLARSYPNPELPLLGLWTQRLTEIVAPHADVRVIAPVPYAPPLPRTARFEDFNRFRRVPKARRDGAVEVLHPRFLVGPGSSAQGLEAASYTAAAARVAARLRATFAFDLIHAHFTYPDGVAACVLGRRHRVPVVITEHAPWLPWMEQAPLVRRQAVWAARACAAQIPVSRYVRRTIGEVLGDDGRCTEPIGMPVDGELFRLSMRARRRRLLFVGTVRHVKGLDVLVEALGRLEPRYADVRLMVVGEAFYRSYRRDFEAVKARVRALGVTDRIDFAGPRAPAEVAELMAESAAVVVPSRAESFSSVLVEALACGTPVVATRSGGPEDIVSDEVGTLVGVEDPGALAGALARILDNPGRYDAGALRRHALSRFGGDVLARRILAVYESATA